MKPYPQRHIETYLKLLLYYRPSGLSVFFGFARMPKQEELIQLVLRASKPQERTVNLAVGRARYMMKLVEDYGGEIRIRHTFRQLIVDEAHTENMLYLESWPNMVREAKTKQGMLETQIAGFQCCTGRVLDDLPTLDHRRCNRMIAIIAREIYRYAY